MLSERQHMQRLMDQSIDRLSVQSIRAVPLSSSPSSPSSSSSPLSQIEYRRDDTESSSVSPLNKSLGTFTFTYKIKDGNNTIERSEKQSPNGSLYGYYTVKNIVNGFLRSIFYSADVDSFSASVFSNKPGDLNYTFPVDTTTAPVTQTPLTQVDVTTAMDSGVEREELKVIGEVNTISQINSTESDFELVTSVVVDTVETTTIREESESATTVAALVEETTTTAAPTTTSSGVVSETSSESSTLDSLTIPDGPIVSLEEVSTSTSPSIEQQQSNSSSSSGASISPSLWYEYEILLNGGRFYRSESTDPITGKLIGSYILLMDPQGSKVTDASTVPPPVTVTSLSSSTVTSKSFIGQSETPTATPPSEVSQTLSSVTPINVSQRGEEEEGNSLELSPQEKQVDRSTSSTAVQAATTTTAASTVTDNVMSSTVQSIAPAGDSVTSEEVIRRRRVQRLRKRHNIQQQQQQRRLRQQQSTTQLNVQVSRSNYTRNLSTVDRTKQKYASPHPRQILD